MNKIVPGWHIIYTRPRHEKKVNARLVEQQIKTFLPTRKVLRTWNDRKKYVEEPLFPSYLFIFLEGVNNYYTGMDTEGSLCYVRSGKEIARVKDSVVENIRLMTDQATNIESTGMHFEPGQQLVIREGSLTGLACEVVQFNNKQKLLVRINLLQRNLLATLPPEYVMANTFYQ
jgi:transcriptional antiterminator RfaH